MTVSQRVICTECYEFRTKDPSGVCAICRRRVAKAPSLIQLFAAEVWIDKPFPATLKLPCETMRDEYMKPRASQAVRDLCATCPKVAYDWCLDWGVANDEQGIWGGLSRPERKIVREGLPRRRGDLTQDDYTLVA